MDEAPAFDLLSESYDGSFTDTHLGRLLRRRTDEVFDRFLSPGDRVLEIGCGTGEDACRLAERGVVIHATDVSEGMLETARKKAASRGVDDRMSFSVLDAGSRDLGIEGEPFDAVISNFGALNTQADVAGFMNRIADWIKPGGRAVIVLMGPFCPIEILYYLLKGKPALAFRRFGKKAEALVQGHALDVYYPSLGRLRRGMQSSWKLEYAEGLGILLPPSFLHHVVQRHQRLFSGLDRLESGMSKYLRGWGDHYISTYNRI